MGREPLTARQVGPGGTYLVRIEEPVDYDQEQAAALLAQVHPVLPPRWGKRTVQVALADAAKRRLRPAGAHDPAAVQMYQNKLEENGLFAAIAKPRGPEGGTAELRIRVHIPHHYDLDEAAALLAKVHPTWPAKAGRRTAHDGLITATRKRMRVPDDPAPEAAEAAGRWRQLLLDTAIFPPEAASQ